MAWAIETDDMPLSYAPKFREYGIRYNDGGTSLQLIRHCPWCGTQLPESLRDAWFDELERLGLEPEDELPDRLRDDRWWRNLPQGK